MADGACSDCGTALDATAGDKGPGVGHGRCDACVTAALAAKGRTLAEFLDSLTAPVFVVDRNCRIVAANKDVRHMVAKPMSRIEGALAGEVLECPHAAEPGGCGGTVHCRSCTIRRTVEQTFRTHSSCTRVPACLDEELASGDRRVHFFVSTESVGGVVLLRIDDA
jgi:hypothetical protein